MMNEDEEKITIGFEMTDRNNYHFKAESTVPLFDSLGEDELTVIGEQLNAFLQQIGYIRKNDNIFMEDLTDEEYDEVALFLEDLRSKKKKESDSAEVRE